MNKNIIIGALIVVVVALAGVFIFSGEGKINTEINFLSETNLKNGDQIAVQLNDAQGNALSEQNITITYQANGQDEDYHVITDSDGKAYLTLYNEPSGEHKVVVKYDGNDKYNGCSGEQTITINEGTSETKTQTQSTATASTVKYNNTGSSAQTGSNTNNTYKTTNNSNYKSNTTNNSNTNTNSNYKSNSNSNSNSNQKYDPKKEYVSTLYYDSELGVYYDDFGSIHGGKYDGGEIYDLRQSKKTK